MYKYFASQQEDEKIILIKRKHGIVFFPLMIMSIVSYSLGLIVVFVLPYYFPILDEGIIPNIVVVFTSLFFLFATLFFFIEWILYYLQVGMVSDKRLVDINQVSLFSRRISEMSLGNVEDITASQQGVIQTMFHYGDVCVQTAGELPNFIFEKVPDPYGTQRIIMQAMDEFKNPKQ